MQEMNRSKIGTALAIVLVLALVVPALAAPSGEVPRRGPAQGRGRAFRDLEGHWATRQIERMVEKGLLQGTGDSRFDPDQPMARAQVAVMLCRSLGLDDEAEDAGGAWRGRFRDEDQLPGWARNHIRNCYNSRLMLGEEQGDGKVFNPNRPITRQEFVALLARATDQANGNQAMADAASDLAEGAAEQLDARFADWSAIDEWAYGYVLLALREGWIAGYGDGLFQPHKPITRAEACTLLERLEGRIGHRWGDKVKGVITDLTADTITVAVQVDDDDDDDTPETVSATYDLAVAVKVSYCGVAASPSDLATGMRVKLYLRDDQAVEVKVRCADDDDCEVEGRIVAVAGDQLTLAPDDDDTALETTYTLAPFAVVRQGRQTVTLTADHVGQTAELKVCYDLVVKVRLDDDADDEDDLDDDEDEDDEDDADDDEADDADDDEEDDDDAADDDDEEAAGGTDDEDDADEEDDDEDDADDDDAIDDDEEDDDDDDQDGPAGTFTGVITAVSPADGTITVDLDEAADQTPSSATETYDLAPDHRILVDGQEVELTADLIGRGGEFTVDAAGEVSEIRL